MKDAIRKLDGTDLNGKRIRLVDVSIILHVLDKPFIVLYSVLYMFLGSVSD